MKMNMGLPPFTWHTFFHSWHLNLGWLVACAALAVGYVVCLRMARARGERPVHPLRVLSFMAGLLVLAWCLCSAIDVYAMALFWVHMLEHLTLITVVPTFLVLGHPLTVLRAAGGDRWRRGFDRVVQHGPVAVVTHPIAGLTIYGVVIALTHLTPFMDAMVDHPALMSVEQAAYVISGWLMLVGTLGEEPIRWRTPYLLRLVVLIMGMIPDTLVGVVLLQTNSIPFPRYVAMRPAWATPGLHDLEIGGSLMWAVGDGLMMFLSMGLVISLITGRTRDRLLGPWLESVRRNTFNEHVSRSGANLPEFDDGATIDDDAALDAYNDMLRRIGGSRSE